jgi:glyoxylase-like metal-dependent hydrolase (beta-lactamase superfamily II)
VGDPVKREAVVIDPAGEEERILDLLREEGLKGKYILNTHGHPDHVLGNERVKEALGVPVCLHGAGQDFFCNSDVRQRTAAELGLSCDVRADIRLQDGDVLEVGELRAEVIHTPGHTPGSVCFLIAGNLFTGDTLFVGAAGRTDLIGGSLDTLLESIETRLLVLPRETVIHPGHDYGETPTSTIGREMEENIYITDFMLDA